MSQSAEQGLSHDERLELAERIRLAFDTPPNERVIQDTWLYAAATAEQFFVERQHFREHTLPPGEEQTCRVCERTLLMHSWPGKDHAFLPGQAADR